MSKIIAFASSKGGAGKTTSSFILASLLAYKGSNVTIIDSDPNHPVCKWGDDGGNAENLTIIKNDKHENLLENIETASHKSDVIIIDLEGVADMALAYAISKAHFVVIPSKASPFDIQEAIKVAQLVRQQEKVVNRKIPYAILLTQTPVAIRSKSLTRTRESLRKNKIPHFEAEVNERELYRLQFTLAQTLPQLSRTSKEKGEGSDVLPSDKSISQAIQNAIGYVGEVMEFINKSNIEEKKESAHD
jgi:chromosome partitioning protein